MDIIWKQLKILTFPFNSYYSFRNPEKKLSDYDESVLFSEISEANDKLDRFKLLKESIYHTAEDTDKWIFTKMIALSNFFLTIRNNRLYLDENDQYGYSKLLNINIVEGNIAKSYYWFFLKRLINKDILKIFFIEDNLMIDSAGIVNNAEIGIMNSLIFSTDSLLEKILDKGISETHMHAGAGRKFSFLWIDFMNNSISRKIEIITYEGVRDIKNILFLAQLVRIIISLYLKEKKQENICKFIDRKDIQLLNCFYTGEVSCGNEFESSIIERIDYYKIKYDNRENSSTDDVKQSTLKNDILTKIFDDVYIRKDNGDFCYIHDNESSIIFPENVMLLRSIKYMKEKKDLHFCRIFTQYIRIKNIFEQYIRIQDNDGKGLDVFSNVYDRQRKFNYQNPYG